MDAERVTVLLQRWQSGDRAALERATRIIYDELHRLAAGYLRRERPEHTLGPQALVAEAYIRLCGDAPPSVSDRRHFIAMAARIMRQVLVDHARARGAEKRGGAAIPETLDESLAAEAPPETLLALDEALSALAELDPRAAEVVELVYFGGFEQKDVA